MEKAESLQESGLKQRAYKKVDSDFVILQLVYEDHTVKIPFDLYMIIIFADQHLEVIHLRTFQSKDKYNNNPADRSYRNKSYCYIVFLSTVSWLNLSKLSISLDIVYIEKYVMLKYIYSHLFIQHS